MPRVSRSNRNVTADHIRYLAARTNPGRSLVDTTNGITLVDANQVLADGSNVTRLLLTKVDLLEDAQNAGLTITEYLDQHAARIAAELNDLRAEGN